MKKKLSLEKISVSSFVSSNMLKANEQKGGGNSRGITVEQGCTAYPVCTGCGCGLPVKV